MKIGDLLLNLSNHGLDSSIVQSEIQTNEDLEKYRKLGYTVYLTNSQFQEKFAVASDKIYYSPSIGLSSFYFNQMSLATCPFYLEQYIAGTMPLDGFLKAVQARELEVASKEYYNSLMTLTDAMRMDYFSLLLKHDPNLSNLYALFFEIYQQSDFGFSKLAPDAVKQIVASKTEDDEKLTSKLLKNFPDTISIYRGGNSASTSPNNAFSWTLDINVANFFATRLGDAEAYIVEATAAKADVIDYFDDNREAEVIVDPSSLTIANRITIKGIDTVDTVFPNIMAMYKNYRSKIELLHFAQKSTMHGVLHTARVLLLTLTIADLLELPQSDRHLLATAAIYHDTKRIHDDKDTEHGQRAMRYYVESSSRPNPMVAFLIEYHCRADADAYAEIASNTALGKNKTKITLLFNIFKDADALDRVRFGLRDLDLNQLRLPVSKTLTLLAHIYLKQITI